MRDFLNDVGAVSWQVAEMLVIAFGGGALLWFFTAVCAASGVDMFPVVSLTDAVMLVFWVFYLFFWVAPLAARDLKIEMQKWLAER